MNQEQSSAEECVLCPKGKISGAAARVCEECTSSKDFQSDEGETDCVSCPRFASAFLNHTSCRCDSGYYAIPFGDFVLFSELDEDQYDGYNQEYISATSPPDFDAHAVLDYWCVPCPDGADCVEPGTVLANVSAQAGYFLGLDNTGTVFIECLNEACDTGGCAQHYTVNHSVNPNLYFIHKIYIYIYIYSSSHHINLSIELNL